MSQRCILLSCVVFFLSCVIAVQSATLSYSTTSPTLGAEDVYNLTGADADVANVGAASATGGDDAATYIAQDRAAQGQSFTTGSNALGYYVSAISLRHTLYTADTTWYTTTSAATLAVRIVQPQTFTSGGTASLSVLASENVSVTGTETNTLGSTSGIGTGNWVTITLASPVLLSANTTYGFDVAAMSGASYFFETNGNLASGTFAGGESYASGAAGAGGSTTLTGNYGDRVFVVYLTANTTPVTNAIDNFESYSNTSALNASWTGNVTGCCLLSNTIASTGSQSMQVNFANSNSAYYTEVTHTFSVLKDLTADNNKDLTLYFRGQSGNAAGQLYVVLQDDGWGTNVSVVNYPGNTAAVTGDSWIRWDIDLNQFTQNNASLNLKHIQKIIIGIGNRLSPSAGGNGTVYIDDIALFPTRCLAQADTNGDCVTDMDDLIAVADQWLSTGSLVCDFTGDSKVDIAELALMSEEWLKDSIWPKADVLKSIHAVPFTEVSFNDEFWLPRLQTNRQVTVPYIFDRLKGVYNAANNRIDNFAIAGGLMTGTPRYDFPFDDTDIYKTLEGASYSLMVNPDPALEQYLDDLIVKITAAQINNGYMPGYLYTIRTNGVDIWCGATPFSNEQSSHELYDAGHLIESAIAHYQATGKTSLLNVAKKFANLLVDRFHPGDIEVPPGHEIVESALARLSEVTGEPNYLALAKYYIDIRGTTTADHSPWGAYYQDTVPVVQQTEAIGHVVRAMYLYMGMADVATRTSDTAYRDSLMAALDKIWHSVNDTKAYVTGGLGAESGGESFGSAYNLPNNGYCETCAQIASVMWNQRMFLYYQDGKYIDVLERTLYNAMISGVSLQGNTFFYPNPLVSTGGYGRSGWFSCNCCIGNIARTIPSVPGYVYARGDNEIYVNLYVASTGTVPMAGNPVQMVQQGGYPWDGNMTITVNPTQAGQFTVNMRIPGWARNQPVPSNLYQYKTQSAQTVTLDVNGTSVPLDIHKGYVAISRTWQAGDQIHLSLPMPVRQVISHPSVAADVNRVALERGPIVYCAEWPDFASSRVTHIYIPNGTTFTTEYRSDMLGNPAIVDKGVVLKGTVKGLYAGTGEQDEPFVAIPYYAWAHRGQGQMAVWLPAVSSLAVPVPAPTPSELTGHWKLDETSGTSASDSSGKSMTGTLKNGLSFTSNSVVGQIGRALVFDGTNDYIDIPDGYSDFAKGCTFSVWVYPTAVKTWARFIDFGNGSSSDNIWFGRQSNTSNLAFEGWSGSSSAGLVTAANVIDLSAWQMFTATVDSAGNAKLYKNGQPIATGTTGVTSVTRINNYIGRSNWSGDQYYKGNMDDVRIYNYCLTDTQVQALYAGQ